MLNYTEKLSKIPSVCLDFLI